MGDPAQDFSNFYHNLMDRYRESGEDLCRFSAYEQETVALYCLNSDYGGNGLMSYFDWHGLRLLEPTLRGLTRIGADRLSTLVSEYAALLTQFGFAPDKQTASDFVSSLPTATQAKFDRHLAEAADLYGDFYNRWEAFFASGAWRDEGHGYKP